MAHDGLPPYRPMREATGLSLRAAARELHWNPGRLSSIERGLVPTEEERQTLLTFLNERIAAQNATHRRNDR